MLDQGHSRSRILEETGAVIGVAGAIVLDVEGGGNLRSDGAVRIRQIHPCCGR